MLTEDLGPWTAGINNIARDHALPKGACLDALNVDFTDKGHAFMRTGRSQAVAIDNAHSLQSFADTVFIGVGTTLQKITAVSPLETVTLVTDLDLRPISYAERGGEVWWSNGVQSGRIGLNGTNLPWVPATPGDIVEVYAGVGTLPAGMYRIAITHAMSDGEESVASEIVTYESSAAGSIIVTLPAAAEGATHFNIYCTETNSATLQKYSTVSAATASVTISAPPTGRQLRARAFMQPLPAGDLICFHGNRMLSVKGEFVYYSEPWDYGVYDPHAGFLALGVEVSIVASVEEGLFVAADKTWFYDGDDVKSASPKEVFPFGAVPGTLFDLPGEAQKKGWYSKHGLIIGSADGSVKLVQRDVGSVSPDGLPKPVQRGLGFIAPDAERGSAWVRWRDGQKHVVFSLTPTASYGERVSADFLQAMALYDNDTTTMSVNLATGATSRYSNWHMNSYAAIDGNEYGCDDVGLHLLEGQTDNYDKIQAAIDLGRLGLGSNQLKSPSNVYTWSKSSTPLIVTIAMPGGESYDYPARTCSDDEIRLHRHDGMKGLMNSRKTWFRVVVRNDDGGAFELSSATVLVAHSKRRI